MGCFRFKLTRKELFSPSLSNPRPRDYAHGVYILDKGWDIAHTLHQIVTTCTEVGLVGTEENYLSSSRVGLLS
jgi:hypothetical protein